jgi:hypothetical protein
MQLTESKINGQRHSGGIGKISASGMGKVLYCFCQNLFVCDNAFSLRCASTYSLKSGKTVPGASGKERVHGCEALVILETPAGIYVANYDQKTSTISAWLSYKGEQAILVRSAPINENNALKNQLISPILLGKVNSVNIECKIRRDR